MTTMAGADSHVETQTCGHHEDDDDDGIAVVDSMRTVSIDRLKTITNNVDERRTLLGQSWDELQLALSQYHASLLVRQEQYELQCGDSGSYVNQLENELERRGEENERLQTKLVEYENKIQSLDDGHADLRVDHEKLRNELNVKENLIAKLQKQMSKESIEYNTEINTLKQSLDALREPPHKKMRIDEIEPTIDVTTKDSAQSVEAPSTLSVPRLALPSVRTSPYASVARTRNDVAAAALRSYDSPMTSRTVDVINHQVMNVLPPTSSQVEKELSFTVKQEIVDLDSDSEPAREDDDAHVQPPPGGDTAADYHIYGNHSSGNHSDGGNDSDCSLNLENFIAVSRPVGAPIMDTFIDNDLAPIQIEKFRLPTGVIAMAPALNAAPPKMHHCSYCYRFFDKSITLREHLKIHLGTHMYECELCSRKFTQKGNLERHQRAVHKEQKHLVPKKRYRKRKYANYSEHD